MFGGVVGVGAVEAGAEAEFKIAEGEFNVISEGGKSGDRGDIEWNKGR